MTKIALWITCMSLLQLQNTRRIRFMFSYCWSCLRYRLCATKNEIDCVWPVTYLNGRSHILCALMRCALLCVAGRCCLQRQPRYALLRARDSNFVYFSGGVYTSRSAAQSRAAYVWTAHNILRKPLAASRVARVTTRRRPRIDIWWAGYRDKRNWLSWITAETASATSH